MYRKILVPLSTDGCGMDAGVDGAFRIARLFGARVEAFYARPNPEDVLIVLGRGVVGTTLEKALREVQTKIAKDRNAAYDHLQTLCRAAGIPMVESASASDPLSVLWHETAGQLPDLVATEGRFADFFVLSGSTHDGGAFWRPVFETALFVSTRPVILMPDRRVEGVGTTVFVAWNGSAQAMRAVTSALPFLRNAHSILIGTVEADDVPPGDAERLRDYLAEQDVDARVIHKAGGGRTAGEMLLDLARCAGADLLVMGGYGHSRVREWALGGATRDVLAAAAMPVLMMH